MNIVFLQDDFPPQSSGGAGFSAYELARGVYKEGHVVSVITTVRTKAEAGRVEYEGLHVYRIVSNYPGRWRAYLSLNNASVVREVEKILREIQPDVVHINNVHMYLSYRCFKIAKRLAKAVVVFTARDVMSFNYGKLYTKPYLDSLDCHTTWRDHLRQAGKQYNPFRNFFIKRYLTYADRICAVSDALRDALVANGIPKVQTIHTGTDVTEWSAAEDEKKSYRKHFGLEGKKVLLFGGRLSEGKGAKKLIEALPAILCEVPNAILLIVGSVDAYAEKMKVEAERLGVGDMLHTTGWIDRDTIRVAYAVADAVVVPSVYLDPFPRVVIEAMASKKPVIGTQYGGAPEIILDGITGYIVNPLHPEEIAEKAIDLLTNPVKADQFGSAGRERIIEDFSLKKMTSAYLRMFTSLSQHAS